MSWIWQLECRSCWCCQLLHRCTPRLDSAITNREPKKNPAWALRSSGIIAWRRFAVGYRRFGTMYQSHLRSSFCLQWASAGFSCKTFYTVFFASITVIPRLTKIISSGITFVSRNVMLSGVSLLAVSNVNNPVGLVGLPYVMWSAHFFVTHILQTEKISSWNGPTVHVCCFMLARASTKTFVSRIHIR